MMIAKICISTLLDSAVNRFMFTDVYSAVRWMQQTGNCLKQAGSTINVGRFKISRTILVSTAEASTSSEAKIINGSSKNGISSERRTIE